MVRAVILWSLTGVVLGVAVWAGVDASVSECNPGFDPTGGRSIYCGIVNSLPVLAGAVTGGVIAGVGIARSRGLARARALRAEWEARTEPRAAGTREERYGPNTVEVERLIERARKFTPVLQRQGFTDPTTKDEADALLAALRASRADPSRDQAFHAALDTAIRAAEEAGRDAVAEQAHRDAFWAFGGLAGTTAVALVVRDLISKEDFDTLTRVWVEGIGPTWDEGEGE